MCCMHWHAHFHVDFKSQGITTKKKVIFSSFIFKSLLVAALYPFFSSHLTVCLCRERIKVKHVILLLLSCILRGLRLSTGLQSTNHGRVFFLPWDTHFRISNFLSILDFRASLEDCVQLWQYLASQQCPLEAHSVQARPLPCHVIPPSYRGRRDEPWGKGTQTIPCFFKMESMKRRMLICSSGSDLISGDSAGLGWPVCCGFSNPRDLQTQQTGWGMSVDRCWHCSVCCGNRSLSQGVQTVCKAVKKTNLRIF